MVERTSFEEANARAEVLRYTYTPTYQLSYLLGKVLLLQLRADEPARLGPAFSLQAVPRHAAAQREPADQLPSPAPGRDAAAATRSVAVRASIAPPRADRRLRADHPGHRPRGRALADRLLARRLGRRRRPDRPTGSDRRPVRRAGRADRPPRRLRRGPVRARRRTSRRSARSRRRWPSRSRSPAGWRAPTRSGWPSPPERPGSSWRCRSSRTRDRLDACLAVAGDWLAVGLDPRPERLAAFPWKRPAAPTLDALVGELVGRGVRRLVLGHGPTGPDHDLLARLVRSYDADILVAGGATDATAISRIRDAGVAGLILGESLLSGAIDFPAALEAAA